ncbi:MAG: hypothetical protein J6D52_01175, partial [Clostridia bacterium]|nr:hypothetical protein [Clostridia bacterium]
IIYDLKNNKKFKYLNKNNICLYDTCLFILYVIRWIYFNKKKLSSTQKEEFDSELLSNAISGYEYFFKCPQIRNINTNLSRLEFYDEVMENYYDKKNKYDIIAAFNEFTIIIKSDIINKSFNEFNFESPLYVLGSINRDMLCELEAKYALQIALDSFNDEIEKF